MKKAVVLLSGGLDSSTCAYVAKSQGYAVYALSFDYGQRLRRELDGARAVASAIGAAEHVIMRFDLTHWGGSALTDLSIDVPTNRVNGEMYESIPVTYVPGRNTIFLAFGLSYAEAIGAEVIFIGINKYDYSGYPDCRPEFIKAFGGLAQLATRIGIEGKPVSIETPLMYFDKAEIIKLGLSLGVDYDSTWSCYGNENEPCNICDSCIQRNKAFLCIKHSRTT